MVKVLNILYFDAGSGKWGRVKPQRTLGTTVLTNVGVVQLHDDQPDDAATATKRVKAFSDVFKSRGVGIIALNGVTPAFASAVMGLDWIRAGYAVSELASHSMLLWHVALPVQLAEAYDRPQCTAINLRKFYGADCVMMAAHTAADASVDARVQDVTQLASRVSLEGTTVILLINPANGMAAGSPQAKTVSDALTKLRASAHFSEDPAVPEGGPTVWLKGTNLMTTGVSPLSGDAFRSCIVATLVGRLSSTSSKPEERGTPASVSSAKEAAAQAVFPSAPSDAKGGGGKRHWSTKHSSSIRVRDNTDEVHYDLTPVFAKSDDAIRALNNHVFAWPCDYCILHGRLLAVHGANADIPSFRQYMATHPPPPRPDFRGIAGAVAEAPPRDALALLDKRRGKEPGNFGPYCLTTPTLAAHRRRVWSAHRATLLHQVTPREMKFDITELVGVGPGRLNEAVARLNGQRPKKADAAAQQSGEVPTKDDEDDPLLAYRFDYALLYASDRHAYWLLAAVDVPCDIAPCRVAAKSLPASVVSILQAEM